MYYVRLVLAGKTYLKELPMKRLNRVYPCDNELTCDSRAWLHRADAYAFQSWKNFTCPDHEHCIKEVDVPDDGWTRFLDHNHAGKAPKPLWQFRRYLNGLLYNDARIAEDFDDHLIVKMPAMTESAMLALAGEQSYELARAMCDFAPVLREQDEQERLATEEELLWHIHGENLYIVDKVKLILTDSITECMTSEDRGKLYLCLNQLCLFYLGVGRKLSGLKNVLRGEEFGRKIDRLQALHEKLGTFRRWSEKSFTLSRLNSLHSST
jgi:hypothetical protein